jgi:hypothetical protein
MDDNVWYLRKAGDGSQFGPLPLKQLQQWAADAQVSPLDRVSSDKRVWVKAPMVPELHMDYLIQVGEEQYYGPTTTGAIAEFLAAGEIIPETSVTNCKDGAQMQVKDILPPALLRPAPAPDLSISLRPGGIRLNLQQRIRELETALLEERRARESAEVIIERLEAKLRQYSDQGEGAVSL